MSLAEWQRNGWLRPHSPAPQEISDLLALSKRDLRSAKTKGLDDDWRFSIAYNATLQAATAALVASGYNVPKGESHHFRVIGSLAFTVELDAKVIDRLDRYRKKRSVTIYDIAGSITAAEAREMQSIAESLLNRVQEWLAQKHPNLLPKA